ncbi:hypothetical protein ACHAW6_010980 [Cyclotella cf. meneghiniana]
MDALTLMMDFQMMCGEFKGTKQRAIQNDPNDSGRRKCRQLEIVPRLHVMYENGELCKCLLSFYLLVTEVDCLKIFHWMDSRYAAGIPKPKLEELPKVPLRLAKIPENFFVGQKGCCCPQMVSAKYETC